MESVELTAYNREATRSTQVKKLRANGRVPGIVYGASRESTKVEVVADSLRQILKQANSSHLLLKLIIDGESGSRLAVIQDIQKNPLTGEFLHVDLHEVKEDETTSIIIPVEVTGEPIGVKVGGGTLDHVLHFVKVEALPKNLPEKVVLDVTELRLGQTFHISDLPVIEGVKYLGKPGIPIASVAQSRLSKSRAAQEKEEQAAAPAKK
jgi:large subunit ribosomal protein L25